MRRTSIVNNGWQNPYIYNARYAVLVAGGDSNSHDNYDCFWNDVKGAYYRLKDNYGYVEENMYVLDFNHGGDLDGWNVAVDGVHIYGRNTVENIEHVLTVDLASKCTNNDFLFFLEVSHGSSNGFQVYDPSSTSHEATENWEVYLKPAINQVGYARSVVILSSCFSGEGIDDLSKEGRIVISSTQKDEYSWVWGSYFDFDNPDTSDGDDHAEFLYNEDGNGFLQKMGSTSSPHSVAYMFENGYDAAGDYDPFMYWLDASHPRLDDNADGVGHAKDALSYTDSTKDGYLAKHTCL